MPDEIRIWERPIEGEIYAIGGDPAEGLTRGDDSVYEVIRCATGDQVAEVQGKIPPKIFGELGATLSQYYNNALIAIENNKDGGANQFLYDAGCRNIYFQRDVTARAYDKITDKLGYNMNLRTRPILVAQARSWMEDGSAIPRSQRLLSQFEIFVHRLGRFEALPGGHDDLVMAWLLAVEMTRVALISVDGTQNNLNPLYNEEEIDLDGTEDVDEWERGIVDVDRLVDQTERRKLKDPFNYPTSMGGMV